MIDFFLKNVSILHCSVVVNRVQCETDDDSSEIGFAIFIYQVVVMLKDMGQVNRISFFPRFDVAFLVIHWIQAKIVFFLEILFLQLCGRIFAAQPFADHVSF
ncbi:Uncharacterised protein [Mycobacteroides abscessus subsp. abscessus]|nr:Uncharacterised protein [Mycobacteroides abscessus subsp. abscessus]